MALEEAESPAGFGVGPIDTVSPRSSGLVTSEVRSSGPKDRSTQAGMPVGHYQLFTFSFASEAVLPDNRIVLAPRFRSCLPLPLPPCVMGTVCPLVWTGFKAPFTRM